MTSVTVNINTLPTPNVPKITYLCSVLCHPVMNGILLQVRTPNVQYNIYDI